MQDCLAEALARLEAEGDSRQFSTVRTTVILRGAVYREAFMKQIRGITPEVSPDELFQRYEQASRQAIIDFPDEGWAYLNLAQLLSHRPSEVHMLKWLGFSLEDRLSGTITLGEPPLHISQEVMDLFETAYRLSPDDPHTTFMLASHYHRRGDLAKAESLATSLLGEPEYVENTTWLIARIRLEQERFDEAIEIYKERLRNTPDSANTHGDLIEAYRLAGRFDDMMSQIELTNAQFPNCVPVRTSLAHYHASQGRTQEARDLFRSVNEDVMRATEKNLGI